MFISKNGLSENIKTEIVDAIERHELIKIKIASNCRVEKVDSQSKFVKKIMPNLFKK